MDEATIKSKAMEYAKRWAKGLGADFLPASLVDEIEEALLAASRPARGYLRASEGQTFEDGETILCAVPLLPSGYDYCVLTVQCDEGLFRLTFDGEPWGWDWSDVEWWMPVPKAPAAESAKGGH